MIKQIYFLLFLAAFGFCEKDECNDSYYVNLAEKGLCEIVKMERKRLLEEYDSVPNKRISLEHYQKLQTYLVDSVDTNTEAYSRLQTSLMEIGEAIGNLNNTDRFCKGKKWSNPLTYAIFAAVLNADKSTYCKGAAGDMKLSVCRECLKPYSTIIKKGLKNAGSYYWDLLILCDLDSLERVNLVDGFLKGNRYDYLIKMDLDSAEKAKVYSHVIKTQQYEYRAYYGDKEGEKELLLRADTIKGYKQKIKTAKLLAIAKTDKTIKKLVEMLNDTITKEDISTPDIIHPIRYEIFPMLRHLFDNSELFNMEYRIASRKDFYENDSGRIAVNKYFNKVADWAKEKYNIDLNNLRKMNYFSTGHSVILRMW